jgi:uncharacterized protein YraI
MKKFLRFLTAAVLSLMAMFAMVAPSFAAENTATEASRAYMARVKVAAANVRSCGSTRCRIVATYRRGTPVHVYYRWGGWSNIGGGRWIASYLLG